MRIQRRRAIASRVGALVSVLALVPLVGCSHDGLALPEAVRDGIGDPYYPTDGNPGYDVKGYAVKTSYDPTTSSFDSVTQVKATAIAYQSSLNLDLSSALTVTKVTVNGIPAEFAQRGPHELVITPNPALPPRGSPDRRGPRPRTGR